MQNWSAIPSNGGTTTITPSSGPSGSAAFDYNIHAFFHVNALLPRGIGGCGMHIAQSYFQLSMRVRGSGDRKWWMLLREWRMGVLNGRD